MNDLTGQTIHGYEIQEKIGEGGYGVVYKAYQSSPGREVAIKIIHPDKALVPEFRLRFEQEAEVIAQLEHPHIVPMYEYWHDANGMYLVMRWLRGGSLRDKISYHPRNLKQTARMVEQLTDALQVAHNANIIHRDLKPDNILFDDHGNAYLVDFGIAKRLNSTKNLTDPGTMIGSPAYLAPEQILRKPLSGRTDLYALGITIYEALIGEHPFINAPSSLTLMMRQLQETLPPLHVKNASLPEAVNNVLQKATHKDPTRRYQDAKALWEDFRAATEDV